MNAQTVIGSIFVVSAFLVLWWALSGERTKGARAALTAGLPPLTDLRQVLLTRSAADRAVSPAMARLAAFVRRFTPAGLVDSLERRTLLAGAPAAWPVERVLAAKIVLGGAGLLFGAFRFIGSPGAGTVLVLVGLGVAGFFLPEVVLSMRADERQKLIRRHLPDTLDQVTISVEAGLGFEAALSRAAHTRDTPLAQEFRRVLQDIQAGVSRHNALRSLVERTDVPELRQFVAAVLQAEGYGIPIASVLRVQAAELRIKRRQAAEERAMKLPVKVVFPLIFCILPTVLIVVIGPAIIRVSEDLLGN